MKNAPFSHFGGHLVIQDGQCEWERGSVAVSFVHTFKRPNPGSEHQNQHNKQWDFSARYFMDFFKETCPLLRPKAACVSGQPPGGPSNMME